jgi:hypothetical protein
VSFPSGVITRIVKVGPFLDLSGQPIDGMVQVQVPAPLKWVATGAILVNTVETIQLDNGIGQKELPIIQAGFVTGPNDAVLGTFAYLFTPILEPNSGDIVPAKYIELGLGDGTPYTVDFNAVSSNDHGAVAYLPGGQGEPGEDGPPGPPPVLHEGTATTLAPGQPFSFSLVPGAPGEYTVNLSVPQGAAGNNGNAGGVPTGGTTGQVLTKTSNADFALAWADNAAQGIPAAGNTGEVLMKASGADYATAWQALPKQVPDGGTTGQALTKNSNSNQDVGWSTIPRDVPIGGATGQLLAKNSATDRDVKWVDPPTGGGGGTSLPNGGTAGQFLKKNSATNGDATWADPVFSIASLPSGTLLVVRRNADGTWPARPTNRTDLIVAWMGTFTTSSGEPPIVSSGTSGMIDGVDLRWVTP